MTIPNTVNTFQVIPLQMLYICIICTQNQIFLFGECLDEEPNPGMIEKPYTVELNASKYILFTMC